MLLSLFGKKGLKMDKRRALGILLANACCTFDDMCEKCSWNHTIDCEKTSLMNGTLKEAIEVILEEIK